MSIWERIKKQLLFALTLFFLPDFTYAAETVDEVIRLWSVRLIAAATAIIVVLVTIAIKTKDSASDRLKHFLFWPMVIVAIGVTFYMAAGTIYLNVTSETHGPVHWHADFRLFACEEELDLIDPKGLSNKIGTPVLHEHADNRIHVEGVVYELPDVSLARFFNVIGGAFTGEQFVLPTKDGVRRFLEGEKCPDGSTAVLNTFVYKVNEPEAWASRTPERPATATLTKLVDPQHYVLSPWEHVPPGDCVIIDYTAEIETTNKMCKFYEIEVEKGTLTIDR